MGILRGTRERNCTDMVALEKVIDGRVELYSCRVKFRNDHVLSSERIH